MQPSLLHFEIFITKIEHCLSHIYIMAKDLSHALQATTILSEQFCATLTSPTIESRPSSDSKSALPLLNSSAQLLKSQTTKLSLLAINPPFTPSAITSVLSAVNENVLPSLVTAALLTQPAVFTQFFYAEIRQLVQETLRETSALVDTIKEISKNGGKNVSDSQKDAVTTTTGRVWAACDKVISVSKGGVPFLISEKSKNNYHPLIKDALQELEEWEPEDEEDDPWGDGFSDGEGDDDSDVGDNTIEENHSHTNEEKDEELMAQLNDEKKHVLRLLKPIANLYNVLSTRVNRLKWEIPHSSQVLGIDKLVSLLAAIPGQVDETVASLYEHEIMESKKYAEQLRQSAIDVVELARGSWNGADEKVKENGQGLGEQFTKYTDTWLKVMDGISLSSTEHNVSKPNG